MGRIPKPNGRKTREWNQDIAAEIEAALLLLDETLGEVDPVKIHRKHRKVRKHLRQAVTLTGWVENAHAVEAMRGSYDTDEDE